MNQAAAWSAQNCTDCKGTGWISYFRPEEIYGGRMTEVFKKCPYCSGKLRSNDFIGEPAQFKNTGIEKFDFSAYAVNIDKIKKLAFSIINDFPKWNNYGKGLYLWSKTPGSGKTFLSLCIAKSIMTKYDLKMRFITAPNYINSVANSYKRERGELDSSEVYRKCKILILDDMGTQIGKDWQQQELFNLINERTSEGITIFTSNMPPEKLNLENRTIDRIIKSSVVIQMPEESIRLKKAKNEQTMFLKDIVGI